MLNALKKEKVPRPLQSQLNLVLGFIHITVKRHILTGGPQKASFHCSPSNTISTQDGQVAARSGWMKLCELMRNGVWCIPVGDDFMIWSGTLKNNTLSVAGAAERIRDKGRY
ncbi:hypothetical protein C5167_007231 [Papaver somniferum]|nr:hypothetical protein C5167_007231 [Papaver somniferum]